MQSQKAGRARRYEANLSSVRYLPRSTPSNVGDAELDVPDVAPAQLGDQLIGVFRAHDGNHS